MGKSQIITVTGIIMPNNWDETGRTNEIALYTYSEEVYTLEHNKLMKELLNLIHQSVEIKGRISKLPDGRISIVVDNFVPFKEFLKDE